MNLFTQDGLYIRLILYGLLVVGLYFILAPWIQHLFVNKNLLKKRKYPFFYKHLLTVTAVLPGNNGLWADMVVMLSLFLMAITFATLGQLNGGVIVMILIAGALPYGILRVILSFKRIEASREGESMVGEVLKQYKLCSYNMQEAIDRSLDNLDHCPNSKRLLFRLSRSLKTYQSKQELRESLDAFTYGVNTRWMKLLSNNMYLAILGGRNVKAGLIDILRELKQAKKEKEESKRMNLDGFIIAIIFNPLVYFLSIIGAKEFFDITANQFFHRQFSGLTLKLFLVLLLINSINFIIVFFQNHRKLDY